MSVVKFATFAGTVLVTIASAFAQGQSPSQLDRLLTAPSTQNSPQPLPQMPIREQPGQVMSSSSGAPPLTLGPASSSQPASSAPMPVPTSTPAPSPSPVLSSPQASTQPMPSPQPGAPMQPGGQMRPPAASLPPSPMPGSVGAPPSFSPPPTGGPAGMTPPQGLQGGSPPFGAPRTGPGPTVQFQAPPPATTPPERPPVPSAGELDIMSRLQVDIARLRLELEKVRLEREIAQQRQPPAGASGQPQTNTTPTQTSPVRAITPSSPTPTTQQTTPQTRPDPVATDRRALPQVIEIRGAAGNFVAVVQTQTGQRLLMRSGDPLPNTHLKVHSIEPRQVNFVPQDGNRGPYPVPVSPPGFIGASQANAPQGTVARPIADTGMATPIAR